VNLAQIRSAVPETFHTQKKRQTDGAKDRTFHSSLHAAKTKMTRSKTARNKQPAACERGHINVLKLHNTVE